MWIYGVFQDTKSTEGIYTQRSAGYRVVVTQAPSQHQGGFIIFYRGSPIFAVEAIRQFGANVIACQLAKGERRLFIVGCYLAPNNGMTIQDMD